MNFDRPITLIAAAAVMLAGCATEPVGREPSPFGNADYEGTVLRAVRHTLSPAELECPLTLISSDDLRQKESSGEILWVKVCTQTRKFSAQSHRVNADGSILVVKRIK